MNIYSKDDNFKKLLTESSYKFKDVISIDQLKNVLSDEGVKDFHLRESKDTGGLEIVRILKG